MLVPSQDRPSWKAVVEMLLRCTYAKCGLGRRVIIIIIIILIVIRQEI